MEREAIGPINVIQDLYGNQLDSLLDEMTKKISLKDYKHANGGAFILVTVNNLDYNPVVLNEVKRRYLESGWGNVFYKIITDENVITFELYFPQIRNMI